MSHVTQTVNMTWLLERETPMNGSSYFSGNLATVSISLFSPSSAYNSIVRAFSWDAAVPASIVQLSPQTILLSRDEVKVCNNKTLELVTGLFSVSSDSRLEALLEVGNVEIRCWSFSLLSTEEVMLSLKCWELSLKLLLVIAVGLEKAIDSLLITGRFNAVSSASSEDERRRRRQSLSNSKFHGFSFKKECKVSAEISVTPIFDFRLQFDVSITIKHKKWQSVKTVLTGQFDYGVEISFEFKEEMSIHGMKTVIGPKYFDPIMIPASPIVIPLTPTLTEIITYQAAVSGSLTQTTTVRGSQMTKLGLSWSRSNPYSLTPHASMNFAPAKVDVGNVKMACSVIGNILAGPDIGLIIGGVPWICPTIAMGVVFGPRITVASFPDTCGCDEEEPGIDLALSVMLAVQGSFKWAFFKPKPIVLLDFTKPLTERCMHGVAGCC